MSDTFCTGSATACMQGFNCFYVTAANWSFKSASGILGLAPSSESLPPSVAQAMKSAGLISEAEATLWLNNNSTSAGGSLTFGGEPDNAIKGKFVKHKIADVNTELGDDLWTLSLAKWKINGNKQITNTTHAVIEPSYQMAVPSADW